MPEKYMQSYRPEKRDILDALAGYVWARKTEVIFNMVVTIIGAGLTLLMIAWLIHQVKAMWGV